MTEAHQEHDSPHEGPVKTPKQVILAVLFGFVVPVVIIVLLASYVANGVRPGAGSEGLGKEAVAARIQPVGRVDIRDASDTASLRTGEQVFTAQCSACHAAGVAGAPKVGDTSAWAPRIGQGYEVLLTSALKGKGAMGPQGGGDFSDFEIGRAVVYMANQGGAKFAEPKPPADAAQPTAANGGSAGGAAAGAAPAAAAATTTAVAPATMTAAATTTPATTAAAPAAGGAAAVPALYTQACQVCHAAGVAGAPKLGDKAAWAPRLAAGIDGLTATAIKGKGAMPPKGGAATASDADIKAVVTYMVSTVK